MIVRALYQPDQKKFLADAYAGSFHLEDRENPDLREFINFCPCGCGHKGRLLVGDGLKPAGARPSWYWNGSTSEPILEPSVNHEGHWHGWLRNGYWEPC